MASTSSIGGPPTGTPTANANFTSGTALLGGFAVYSGTGTNVTVTGLTNGTPYFFKVFTRTGSVWSAGVQTSVTPAAPPEPGEILVGWELEQHGGSGTPASITADFYETGISTSSPSGVLSRGSGLVAAAVSAGGFGARSFVSGSTLQNAIDGNSYFTFTITPLPGYLVNISSIDFTFIRNNATSSPDKIHLRSSTDGFVADIQDFGQIDLPANTTPNNYSVITPGLINIMVPIEFRLYGYEASNAMSIASFRHSATSLQNPYDIAVMGTAVPNTWTGQVSNVWNVGGNWSFGTIPNAGDDVLIPQITNPLHFNPVIAALNPNVRNITLNSGANLTIANNASLTVSGILTNNGTVTVNSGGALVQTTASTLNPANTGIFQIRRQLPGTNNGFRYIGSPIEDLAATAVVGITATGTNGAQLIPLPGCSPVAIAANSPYGNILEIRENPTVLLEGCAQSLWHVKSAGLLDNGRAYAMRGNGGQTISFNGNKVNNGIVNYAGLTRQTGMITDHISGGITRGWHLVANPYPSPIVITGTDDLVPQDFDGQIHIFNSATGTWQPLAAPSTPVTIAAGQGFMVRKTLEGGTATLSFNNGMREAISGFQFFDAGDWYHYMLKANVTGNGYNDQTIVFFNPEATPGFDPALDVNKMTGPLAHPLLFTNAVDQRMAYNGLPLLDAPVAVPMSFYVGTAGSYTLSFEEMQTSPATAMVYLEDKQTGIWTNLRVETQCSFTAQVADAQDRFVIHFEPPVSIVAADESCLSNDGSISISNPSNETWTATLSNATQSIQATVAQGETVISNLSHGNYSISLATSSYTTVEEISIAAATPIEANIAAMPTTFSAYDLIQAEVENPIESITYMWYLNDLMAGTGTQVSFAIADAGAYTLRLEALLGACKSTSSNSFTVEGTTSLSTLDKEATVRAYPNPANELVTLVWNSNTTGFELVRIIDITGRVVQTINLNNVQGNQVQLDLRDVAEGMYLIAIEGKNSKEVVRISVVH